VLHNTVNAHTVLRFAGSSIGVIGLTSELRYSCARAVAMSALSSFVRTVLGSASSAVAARAQPATKLRRGARGLAAAAARPPSTPLPLPDADAAAAEALLDALPGRTDGDTAAWLRRREEETARARALAQAAADRGCARGATILGYLWRDGLGGPRDIDRAKLHLRVGADAGDPFAQFALGNLIVRELDEQGQLHHDEHENEILHTHNHDHDHDHVGGTEFPQRNLLDRTPSSAAVDGLLAASGGHGDRQPASSHHRGGRMRAHVVFEDDDEAGTPRAKMHMDRVPKQSPAQLVRRVRKERKAAGFSDEQAREFEEYRQNKVLAERAEQRQNAIALLNSAIDGGVHEAAVALGNTIIHEDPIAAVEYYKQAAMEAHVPAAHFNLGHVYYGNVKGIEKDHKLSLKHLAMAAQLGDANAQFFIGHVYRVGDLNVKPDPTASLQYVELAAAQGHPGATYYLALMHRNGEGGLVPSQSAFRRYLDQACELDHGEALACLADMYYKGTDGADVDLVKALYYYERAGQAGESASFCSAAAMHFHGFGTKKDYHKAFLLYQYAAVDGSTIAMQNLGSMYFHGHGVPKNLSVAEHFFRMVDKLKKEEMASSEMIPGEGIRAETAPPRVQPHTQAEAEKLRPPRSSDQLN
jgi:TPR repeat protein